MTAGTVLNDPGEMTEVLATPRETGDRYQLRLTMQPGGGSGLRGFGLHSHAGLVEILHCVSGNVVGRRNSTINQLHPGDRLEVPAGILHGLKNTSDEPSVVDVDMTFTWPGPRRIADLMAIGVAIDTLVRDGSVSRWTGYPPLLHLAVIEAEHPEAMEHAGLAGFLMPVLARLGRLRGYRVPRTD